MYSPSPHRALALASSLVCLLAVSPLSAQQSKPATPPGTEPPKGEGDPQKAAGVILKVEKVTRGATPGSTIQKEKEAGREEPISHRLTINTSAVWRDWARDQGQLRDTGPAKRDAAKGERSVATKGEPAEANSLVVIDVGPKTVVETRFRHLLDETAGDTTKPGGEKAEGSKGDDRQAAKPVQFRREDLLPGLFVEVEFRHIPAQNPASSVRVIRPLRSDVPPETEGSNPGK